MRGARWGVLLASIAVLGARQESTVAVEHFRLRGEAPLALALPKAPGAARVLVGGALTLGSSKAFLGELLESGTFDAVAVGVDDLAVDRPELRELLASEKVPFVCANVKGAGRSHVVRTLGGVKVAFVGATRAPAYRKDLTPKDWIVEDPAAALAKLLPGIAKEADFVVLLAVMDRLECAELLKSVPGLHAALVPAVGGSDPAPLTAGGAALAQSPDAPAALGTLTLKVADRKVTAASNRVEAVDPPAAERERVRALYARHAEDLPLSRLLVGAEGRPAVVLPTPTSLEEGKPQALGKVHSDGTVEIRIGSIRKTSTVGDRKAPDGSCWLVIESEWKNTIPLAGGQASTVYRVANATDNLYLIVNAKSYARVDTELSAGPDGLLQGTSITAEKFGSTRRGNLVFPIPSAGVETLQLQFHDFRHPEAVFPLLARPPERKWVEETPIVPTVKNEILEVGVFKVMRGKDGSNPEGAVAIVDLRARSLVSVEIEGKRVGVAGDLDDIWKGLKLISDGEVESEPEAGGSLPRAPRFLPGALTGWPVFFKVPAKAKNLEVRWSFPEMALPGGRVVRPAPLTITLGQKETSGPACPKCRHQCEPNDKFCDRCGAKLHP